MKGISKLVWAGLALNICYLGAVVYLTTQIEDGELTIFARNAIAFLQYFSIPFLVSILLQIISLPLLFKSPKWGLALAIIGSLIILPLSMIFLAGYMFSYEKHCNKGLEVFSPNEKNTPSRALIFKTSMFYVQGGISLAIGLFILADGVSVGGLLVCTGIIFISNAMRLKHRVMIGVSGDKLILTPALYAETCLIPLTDVTLIKENKNVFKLHIHSAGVDRKCSFSKKMIAGENAQADLAAILSTLPKADSEAVAVSDKPE